MKIKLFEREITTKFNTVPFTNLVQHWENESIIKDAEIIYQTLILFIKNYEGCFEVQDLLQWDNEMETLTWCSGNISPWIELFKKIAQCRFEYDPFDSLDYYSLKSLNNEPNFEFDKNAFLKIEHHTKFTLVQQEFALITNMIGKFKQRWANSFTLSFYWMNLNRAIREDLQSISDFIAEIFEPNDGYQSSNNGFLDLSIDLSELETTQFSQLYETINDMISLLLKLEFGIDNHYGLVMNGLTGYTHLTEELKHDYNAFPNVLDSLEPSFVMLNNYVEKISVQEGLNTWLKEITTELKQRVNGLKQGSIPNDQDDLLKDLNYSLTDWSKLCLPRPDFQSDLTETIDEAITTTSRL